MKSAYDVIKRPIITEKASDARDNQNKITFSVDTRSTKTDVKEAIEKIFKVEVEKVNILCIKGKEKRHGRQIGRQPGWKKAVVSLKKGSTIEVFDQV